MTTTPGPRDVEILYLDQDLVVVNKPSGTIVHRGWANDRDPMLQRVRDALGQHVYPIHRLDRGTSGALLFALSQPVAAELGRSFAEGEAQKTYLALVRGVPQEAVTVDHPLRYETGETLEAITAFRRLAVSPMERCSLVEAQPHHGRQHQIRRHLKHLSHPIIGDVKYGKGPINRHFREQWNFHRLGLHAAGLSFKAPNSSEWIEVVAPIPEDFRLPLVALGLLADSSEELKSTDQGRDQHHHHQEHHHADTDPQGEPG